MKVLLTGAGGFLGRIIRQALTEHEVTTLGRGEDMDLRLDIGSPLPDLDGFDMVVHAAGKAHVIPPKDRREAPEFMRINHLGTENLLDAVVRKGKGPKTLVFISSVSVYGREEGMSITETHTRDASTPYALSKKLAEDAIDAWSAAHGIPALILRLPLVVGEGAPGNLGAMERHLRRGTYLRIGTGSARRSMVLGTDVAGLIAGASGMSGTYNLTDGHHPSFRELDTCMASKMGVKVRSIPEPIARFMAKTGDYVPGSPFNTYRFEKLSRDLTFSDEKARREIGWSPSPVLNLYRNSQYGSCQK